MTTFGILKTETNLAPCEVRQVRAFSFHRAGKEIVSRKINEPTDLQILGATLFIITPLAFIAWLVIIQPHQQQARGKVKQEEVRQRELTDTEVGINTNDPLQFNDAIVLSRGIWSSNLLATKIKFGNARLYQDSETLKFYYIKNDGVYELSQSDYASIQEPLSQYVPAYSPITINPRPRRPYHQEFFPPPPASDNSAAILAELRRANDIAERRESNERFWAIENSSPQPDYSYEIVQPRRTPIRPPVSIYGDSTKIGNTIYHNYYSTDGQYIHGDSTRVGNSIYTTIYGN